MKLKKIASLMLAGIMAVSMLAGCGEGKKDDSSSSSSEITSVSNAAAAINAELKQNKDVIEFTGSDELKNAVETYYAHNPIGADTWKNLNNVENNTCAGMVKTMLKIDKSGMTDVQTMITETASTGKTTGVVVWAFNQKMNTEAGILKSIGYAIDQIDFPEDSATTTDAKVYSYSGNAELIEVKSANGAASAWVVAVVITKDYVAA